MSRFQTAFLDSYLLHSTWLDLEVSRNVAAENTGLQCLNVTANVCFRGDQVSLVHLTMSILVSVRHNDITPESFDL